MERTYQLAAGMAAALLMAAVTGCEGDLSAASRPRTRNVLAPENGGVNNAEHRETEIQGKPVPQDRGPEFPGQSRAPIAGPQVATLASWHSPHWQTPQTQYNTDFYNASIPHLSDRPPAAPTPGATPAAGTPWVVEHSWGEGLPLQNYPHRAWPESQATYQAAQVKHNPTYYFFFQDFVPSSNNTGTYVGDWRSNFYEIPWFYANTVALPVLMVLQGPFAQVRTERLGQNPVFLGYLPPAGNIVPAPVPGIIHWDYPFLRNGPQPYTNGTGMPSSTSPTPGVDTDQGPGMAPIPPTPGLPVVPAPASNGNGSVLVTPQTSVQPLGTAPATQPGQ